MNAHRDIADGGTIGGTREGDVPGHGRHFATEAVSGARPSDRNTPVPRGLTDAKAFMFEKGFGVHPIDSAMTTLLMQADYDDAQSSAPKAAIS